MGSGHENFFGLEGAEQGLIARKDVFLTQDGRF